MIAVCCLDGTPPATAQNGESAAPRTCGQRAERGAGNRARGSRRGAARLHPKPGRRGTRDQPFDVQPAGAAADRDIPDALGDTTDPCRRAGAAPCRAAASRSRSRANAGTARAETEPPRRGRRTHPRGSCVWLEPGRDRPPAQRLRPTHITGRPAMVAVHRESGPATSAPAPSRRERPWVTCSTGTKMVSTTRQQAAELGRGSAHCGHRDRRHLAPAPNPPPLRRLNRLSVWCQPHQLR